MHEVRIVVVGSFVLDMVLWVPYFPREGETLHPTKFEIFAGGKGFNQALTARRCGAGAAIVGMVGDDPFGQMFFDLMSREGIDSSSVTRNQTLGTSLGIPMINPQGENCIIGIPRANTGVRVEDVEAAQDLIAASDALMLQLEIPVDASLRAAQIASESGIEVVFNPAPAHHPIDPFIGSSPRECVIDWIIPNEVEAEMITGLKIRDPESAVQAARNLLDRGIRKGVIVTLGKEGAVAVTHDGEWRQPAFQVTPVDPTGAGDAFCGAFAVALAEGMEIEKALRFAAAAGAICVTIAGAEPSLPRRSAIEDLLAMSLRGGTS